MNEWNEGFLGPEISLQNSYGLNRKVLDLAA